MRKRSRLSGYDIMGDYAVEVFVDNQALLAEGPFYDHTANELIWVDILNKRINFTDVSTKHTRTITLPECVGAAIPVEGSASQLVALVGRSICIVDRQTGEVQHQLAKVDEDHPKNRLNDGKCDTQGRLWCGTMGYEAFPGDPVPKDGSLYCYNGTTHVLTQKVTSVSVSNGMAWSPNNDKMFYIDSEPKKLWSYDFDDATGTLMNQQVLVDYHVRQLGNPDGMCTDSEGRLWVAGFFDGTVFCWDPSTGELLAKVEFPARRTTSCCFGGPDCRWLFVTTARLGAGEEELTKYPLSGAIFVVKEPPLGAKGVLPSQFKWMMKP